MSICSIVRMFFFHLHCLTCHKDCNAIQKYWNFFSSSPFERKIQYCIFLQFELLWFYLFDWIWISRAQLCEHSTIQLNWAFHQRRSESFAVCNLNGSIFLSLSPTITSHTGETRKMQQIQPYGEWWFHMSFITVNDTFSSVLI